MRLRGALVAAAVVATGLVVAGCGRAEVSLPSAAATQATAPAASAPASTPAPQSPEPASPPVPSASGASASAAPQSPSPGLSSVAPGIDVVMDPALLQILPAAIGTAKVSIEPDSFSEAVQDPSFVASVDSAAFAIVTEGGDLASGVVAHLRPDVYSDAFFRDWRDSYDEGACGQAGGVAAHAETTLGDRPAFITTCAGGLRVYHAYVPEREVIVSVFSLGEGRFGEQLLAGLRP